MDISPLARLPRHAASLARFAIAGEHRSVEDGAAQHELERVALPLPEGLELEWLGVAGYRLTYEGATLLLDPYFSRVPLSGVLRREPALPDLALIERVLGEPENVVGIAVGHTHFDHAVDAPAIARRHGCSAFGSASLVKLMRAHGLAGQAVEVVPHHPYELGPFTLTFVPSRHSKLVLGLAVPYDGELTCEHLDSLSPAAYRCGQVYGIHIDVAGATLYHQGSADLLDDEITHRGVDVFLAGVAGRSFTPDYWKRILGRLQPSAVVASHYDDFFRPLDAPLGFAMNVNLAAVPDEIRRVARDVTVATLPAPQIRTA